MLREAKDIEHVSWQEICSFLRLDYKVRSTGTLVILCPFHKERTPSLHLWPKSSRFHCHGCHEGGTKAFFLGRFVGVKRVHDLLELYEKVSGSHYDPAQQLFPFMSTPK